MSNLQGYSEPELQRWLHLRAIEWSGLPAFVTQPIVPILFIFYPWTHILATLLVVDFFWCCIGYSLVSVSLAKMNCLFVIICKWPAALGSAIYLFTQHRIWFGIFALLWPMVAAFIGARSRLLFTLLGVPRYIGKVELNLAKQIGYVPQDAELGV
jgi:hypothetical protein